MVQYSQEFYSPATEAATSHIGTKNALKTPQQQQADMAVFHMAHDNQLNPAAGFNPAVA